MKPQPSYSISLTILLVLSNGFGVDCTRIRNRRPSLHESELPPQFNIQQESHTAELLSLHHALLPYEQPGFPSWGNGNLSNAANVGLSNSYRPSELPADVDDIVDHSNAGPSKPPLQSAPHCQQRQQPSRKPSAAASTSRNQPAPAQQPQAAPPAKRQRMKTSLVWDHFVKTKTPDGIKFKCKYCPKVLTNHTGFMWAHMQSKHKEKLKGERLRTLYKEKTSPVWDHFDATADGRVKCNYCHKDLSKQTGSMMDHLQNMHSDQLKVERQHLRKKKNTSAVWDHFEATTYGRKAKCNYCHKDISKRTNLMEYHLKSKHNERKAKGSTVGLAEPELMDDDDASWNDENIEELNTLLTSTPEEQTETWHSNAGPSMPPQQSVPGWGQRKGRSRQAARPQPLATGLNIDINQPATQQPEAAPAQKRLLEIDLNLPPPEETLSEPDIQQMEADIHPMEELTIPMAQENALNLNIPQETQIEGTSRAAATSC